MSEQPRSGIGEAAERLDQIAASLNSEETDDRQAAELTAEAARLAAQLVSEAETEMRRAATTDE